MVRPAADRAIWFSRVCDDALKHGADTDRRETYAIKANVTIRPGAVVERKAVVGNPLAVAITTSVPLPIQILELYVRRPGATRLETITGAGAIKTRTAKILKAVESTGFSMM